MSEDKQQQYDVMQKYQDILDDAQDLRRKGAINSAELSVVSLIIQGIFCLGMDIGSDLAAFRNNGFSNGSDAGEGETPQMDLPFEGDPGDESAVRSAVPQS
tara:strand:- start:7 stop:309 length:303 start_codon:yes stop_codon:yes gene_type:complete